jgi:hypothetical protein
MALDKLPRAAKIRRPGINLTRRFSTESLSERLSRPQHPVVVAEDPSRGRASRKFSITDVMNAY